MSRIEVDTAEWPLVTIRFPAAAVADEDLRAYLGTVGWFASRGARYGTVADMRLVTAPLTAAQRWMFDAWLRRNLERLEACSVANAVVVGSALAQHAVETAYWRWRDPPRFRLFDELEAARAWCRERLERAGLRPGPAPEGGTIPVPAPPVPSAETLDLFDEPAFVVRENGELVFANRCATELYDEPPPWLAGVVSREAAACPVPIRIARIDQADEPLFLVIPQGGGALPELPPSLARVARLLCEGLSDKEIAHSTDLSLPTVRTYVRRLYERLGIHSRAELIRMWYAGRDPL